MSFQLDFVCKSRQTFLHEKPSKLLFDAVWPENGYKGAKFDAEKPIFIRPRPNEM